MGDKKKASRRVVTDTSTGLSCGLRSRNLAANRSLFYQRAVDLRRNRRIQRRHGSGGIRPRRTVDGLAFDHRNKLACGPITHLIVGQFHRGQLRFQRFGEHAVVVDADDGNVLADGQSAACRTFVHIPCARIIEAKKPSGLRSSNSLSTARNAGPLLSTLHTSEGS